MKVETKRLGRLLGEVVFQPEGLIDQVYRALADAILSGKLSGGQRLLEDDLKKAFNVSRTPIREAFKKLEKRGLVKIIPRRGTFVQKVTESDIEQWFSIRAVLEGLAAKEAYLNNDDVFRDNLRRVFTKLDNAATRKDARETQKSIYLFHKTFILASKKPHLIDMLRNVPMHFMWEQFLWHYSDEELRRATQRYRRLLNLFLNKKLDAEEVETGIKRHVNWAGEKFIVYLKDKGKF